MRRRKQLGGGLVLIGLMTSAYSQETVSWRDPSTHKVQFVTVDRDVRLKVLDWGGSGRPVVLLASLLPNVDIYRRCLAFHEE